MTLIKPRDRLDFPEGPRRAVSAYRLSAIALVALLAAGCTVVPVRMEEDQQRQLVEVDRAQMFASVQVPQGPVSLEEAVARSLKHNLDHRLALLEGVLRRQQLDLSRYDMLPVLAANAGWTSRSNEYLTISKGATVPSESQDQQRRTADLGLTWNVLDFGVSYYQAKQNADLFLIAEERRRKVVNQIVQQVRAAYWRAATSALLHREVAPMMAEAQQALRDARAIEQGRLSSPIESLQYQKSLLELTRELQQIERDMAVSKAELTGLMGLPPGTPVTVQLPTPEKLRLPEFKKSIDEMESIALINRPELREERYQQRITAADARKALLRMLPGISFSVGTNYDSNSYLVNHDWNEAGLRVTWNLLNVLSGSTQRSVQETRQQVADMRRQALSMAVLTQVHVGQQQLMRAEQNFRHASEMFQVESRIYQHVSNAAEVRAQTALQRIRARLSALYADVGRYYAYAEVQSAFGNLNATLGQDTLPPEILQQELPVIQDALINTFGRWYTQSPVTASGGASQPAVKSW